MRRGKTMILLTMVVAALACTGVALSQSAVGGKGPGTLLTPEEEKAMIEKNRLAASKEFQASLSANDEEWKVLEPKIETVRNLQEQDARGILGVYIGTNPSYQPPNQTDLQKAVAELAKILKNKDAKPEDIKAALDAYRKMKAKINDDLEKARKELRSLLTDKQEAQLELRGVLD